MLRRLLRAGVLGLAMLATLGAGQVGAVPGVNAGAAAACENGGHLTYTTTDGTRFKNEGQCVKYAAKGNALMLAPVARCRQEAIAAGIVDPSLYTIITGTEYDDVFNLTGWPYLICGFGGEDSVYTLDADDVFLGGDGNDTVVYMYGGTFNGGGGVDYVFDMFGGTFNGGAGDDVVYTNHGGTFIQD